MRYFAGIDVSLEDSSVCVVDGEGRLVREVKVLSEPEALVAFLGNLGVVFERIGLEAGPLSQWLHAGLGRAGLPVVLIEMRHVKAALSAMTMKTDKHDARGIAQLMRLGWFKPVHVKTLLAQEVRALLTARKLLVEKLRDVDNSLRGILRGFGLKVGRVGKPGLRTTLGEALERYLAEVTPEKKGAKQETNRIKAWLRDPLADRPLASIRSMDISAWRNERTQAGKAPTTIKNALTIIDQVFQLAATEWGMEGLRNPVRGVKMPRGRPARERRLEPGEEERLLKACALAGNIWLQPVAMWAIETAMRQGEILGLARRYIRGSVAYLPDTKIDRPRSVPLSSRALGILQDVPAAIGGVVFPITQDSLEYYWRKACGAAGIEDLHFHDLRHEATSRLFERGLDAMEVMAITGHSTTEMLKRYTHFRAAQLALKLG